MHELYEHGLLHFSRDMVLVNGLLKAYSIMRLDGLAENLFLELLRKKVKVTTQTFTLMIKCHYRNNNLDKCWELYQSRYRYIHQEDDVLINTMINICAATHDAEKAKGLWNRMATKGSPEGAD